MHNGMQAENHWHALPAHLSIIPIQPTLLEILSPVVLQRLAIIQRALPAVISLLVWRLHTLAVYAERCCASKLLPCISEDGL